MSCNGLDNIIIGKTKERSGEERRGESRRKKQHMLNRLLPHVCKTPAVYSRVLTCHLEVMICHNNRSIPLLQKIEVTRCHIIITEAS
jgi:hypothetical protein